MVDDMLEILTVVLLPFAWIAFQIVLVTLLIIFIVAALWRSLEARGND